jgi:hypothetical protein
MDLTKHLQSPVIAAIYDHYKGQRKQAHRPHLGGSQIGNKCKRALWYQFRWMASPEFEGRILRLFETGDREEDRVVKNLRDVGLKVWAVDPDTGRQINFEKFGGHFALSLDGMIEDMPESNNPHVLEIKTMNEKAFKQLGTIGVQKSKPVYYAQCQIGMRLADIPRACFIAVNKNTDQIYIERLKLDKEFADGLLEKAKSIIFAEKPPAKISDDPSWYECKFCDMANVCHNKALPEINCRTCANVTADEDGTWHCNILSATLDIDKQRIGCGEHLFNPYAMPWPVRDSGENWVEYMKGNGEIYRNETESISTGSD